MVLLTTVTIINSRGLNTDQGYDLYFIRESWEEVLRSPNYSKCDHHLGIGSNRLAPFSDTTIILTHTSPEQLWNSSSLWDTIYWMHLSFTTGDPAAFLWSGLGLRSYN